MNTASGTLSFDLVTFGETMLLGDHQGLPDRHGLEAFMEGKSAPGR